MFEPLGSIIRLRREALGLTCDQLARLSGVSRTRLMGLERGNDNVSLAVLLKITNTLQMTELRIGGMTTPAVPPDPNVLAIAAEGFLAARKIVDGVLALRADLEREEGRVRELLGGVIKVT